MAPSSEGPLPRIMIRSLSPAFFLMEQRREYRAILTRLFIEEPSRDMKSAIESDVIFVIFMGRQVVDHISWLEILERGEVGWV